MDKNIFEYIKTEENNFKTVKIPLSDSKEWNMYEHITRCYNVANGWFHSGKNDGLRPYDDIVTPVINVAFRSEGFDVKDIVPFVDSEKDYYKSFFVKKAHPKWARKHELDTFIDEVVESSVIYDLVLVKNVNDVRPEVVDLRTIAFCDQTDIMAGPICIKHYLTIEDLVAQKGKWFDDAIDSAIFQAEASKKSNTLGDKEVKTPGKYIEVYELRGNLSESWLKDDGDKYKYIPQSHYIAFYQDEKGNKDGIVLYKGKDKPLKDNFKTLKIDQVRSKGRACGKSIVETLFEPQVWNNYSAIKIKNLLDSAFNVLISDSDEIKNQKLTDLKSNTILSQEKGANTQKLTSDISQLTAFQNYQVAQENKARVLGSASDTSLGRNPTSGTPFSLQALVVQEGQGMHEYRQGKIATFFSDVLYRDWILEWLIKDLNKGKKFSEELTLDELIEIGEIIANNEAEKFVKNKILEGVIVSQEDKELFKETYKNEFIKDGNRKFFELLENELKDIPVDVYVNIKGKQRYMAQNADKITNLLREIIRNPQAFSTIPGVGKAFNQLLEESGMSAIDFTQITQPSNVETASKVNEAELKVNNQ